MVARRIRDLGPRCAIEILEDAVGDEACRARENVSVARLLIPKKSCRHDQMQMLLGPRHRDIEQSPFFFDLLWVAGRHIGGDVAIGDVQHEYSIPLLPFHVSKSIRICSCSYRMCASS